MPTYKGKDKRWRYRFAFKGKRYSGSAPKGSNTEKTAATMEKQHIEKLLSRTYTGKMPTLGEFCDRYLEYQNARMKPLTYVGNETMVRVHIKPHPIAKKRLDDIGKLELDELVTDWMKAGTAPTTCNVRMGNTMRIFSLAAEWNILKGVPKYTKLKIPEQPFRFLSKEEAAELLNHAHYGVVRTDSGDWYGMILVGLRTGMRIGELRGLQCADVSVKPVVDPKTGEPRLGGQIHIQRTDPGDGSSSTSTKGGRTRVVPLTDDAARYLEQRIEYLRKTQGKAWTPGTWVWPSMLDPKKTTAAATCAGAMERITRHAKIEDCGWHTLRHTFASWLVMEGVPLRVVQELLGHYDIKMTMRYAHLAPGFAHQEAMRALDTPLTDIVQKQLPSGDDEDDD